jgi:uncharacterized membrane protein YdcZ (DUF606 family)
VVLVAAVLGARPLSVLLLRRGPLAPMLASIPRPIRFIAGVGAATAISYLIVSVLGFSTVSDFFTMVLALAVSFLLIHLLLDADDYAGEPGEPPSLTVGLGATLALGAVVFLFAAGPALADNLGSHSDGWGTAAAAAGAAAGAAGLASGSASKKKKEPNPPPWYIPDGFAEAFGYDSPYDAPPADPNKPPPDPNKPPPGWPKQRK